MTRMVIPWKVSVMRLRKTFLLPVLVLLCAGALSCGGQRLVPSSCRPAFMLPPADPGTDYLQFYALGDTGSGNARQAAVASSMARLQAEMPASFALLLGDNFYPRGVRSTDDRRWQNTFEGVYDPALLDFPFYAVLGNHDYRGDEAAQVEYTLRHPESRWEMPERFYCFQRELPDGTRVELFGIDTNTIRADDVQLAWLDSALSASTADWKIVFGHHVLYSNGHHGDDPKLIARLGGVLARYAVDIYLAGHEHDLQILAPVSGVHYLVSGAGSRVRNTRCLANTVYAASLPGFMAFRVSKARLVVFVVLEGGKVDFAYTIDR
jgi:tartrate-resistant acid phosphatase type 5